MHYHGPIVRPQTEADSIFIEVTVGCTHNSCTFCNFYKDYPFRVAPLAQVEADLKEAASDYPNAKKVWASGGNPFALSTDKLIVLAKLFQKYLPKAKISTYARVNDLYQKSVEDIRYLHELGFDDIVLGIESADDEVLSHVNKGYTAANILSECRKLEEAGMEYRVIYLGGLAGSGNGVRSAKKTVEVLNQLHPNYMFLTAVAVLRDTKLYEEVQRGEFTEESEKERLQEFCTLIEGLQNEITVFSATSTVSIPFIAKLPVDREKIVSVLNKAIESLNEESEQMIHARRARMVTV